MASRIGVAIAGIVAASLAAGGSSAATTTHHVRLVAFRSCPELLGYVKAQAAHFVTPYGLGRPVAVPLAPGASNAPQQGVDFSGTNVQEAGVDEPDVVKTNGVSIFA